MITQLMKHCLCRCKLTNSRLMAHKIKWGRGIGIPSQNLITYTLAQTIGITGHNNLIRGYADHVYSSKKVNLVTPLFLQAEKFVDRIAIIDQHGSHSYGDLLHFSNKLADSICEFFNATDKCDIKGETITFLCGNNALYVVTQWAIWMCGGIAVPLSKSYPASEIKYFIKDSQSKLVMVAEEYAKILHPVVRELDVHLTELNKNDFLNNITGTTTEVETLVSHLTKPEDMSGQKSLRDTRNNRLKQLHQHNKFKYKDALIVYTSGTTGKPKGVLHTHHSLQAMMDNMMTAWAWSPNDVVLHVLPLHHVHGIVNVLMTPLYVGAACVMLPEFDAKKVWSMLLSPSRSSPLERSINLFMAVPTIYAKLIDNYERRLNRGRGTRQAREYVRAVCSSKIRLMVSGSAALPLPVLKKWEEITGHRLLERYGMTEIGMGLTTSLQGNCMPGTVGMPFPSVEVAIAKANAYSPSGYDIIALGTSRRVKITKGSEGEEGELLVKGPSLFKEYWNRPDATKQTFTTDGWFKTGDTACYKESSFKILGRTSVDIIKSGGYKLSALDIERHLLSHPDISDVAVVGLPDITWGQRVAAVVVLKGDCQDLTLEDLREWGRDRMAAYQLPSMLKVLDEMPRNAMGKVNKKNLLDTIFVKEMKQNRR